MVKENPNKESCKERMKELIRTKHLNRNRVVVSKLIKVSPFNVGKNSTIK